MDLWLALHCVATFYMTGVIWFVQLVHYPLFASLDRHTFAESMRSHQSTTTFVVAPAMLVELLSAVAVAAEGVLDPVFASLNLFLLAAIWLTTFAVVMPIHSSLLSGFDAQRCRRLVRSNGWRTALWSARAALLVYVVMGRMT